MVFMTWPIVGEELETLTMAQLPPAIAPISGAKVRLNGKFQGETIRTTPNGSR